MKPDLSKISPLPWKCEDGPNGVIRLLSEGKPYLAAIRYSDNPNLSKAEAESNAAYIVNAANAYPKLVEALKKAGVYLTGLAVIVGQDANEDSCVIRIREALKAAGELEV